MLERIERRSKALQAISAVAAVAAAVISYVMVGRSGQIARSTVALIVLPWVVFFAAFLPLIYLSWFRNRKAGALTRVLKVFYYAFVLGCVVVFGGIYGRLLFG